jgi:hypothetical protein
MRSGCGGFGAVADVGKKLGRPCQRVVGAIDVFDPVAVADDDVVRTIAARDIAVGSDLDGALVAGDHEPNVAPGREARRGQPVDPAVGRAGAALEEYFAHQLRVCPVWGRGCSSRHHLEFVGAEKSHRMVNLMTRQVRQHRTGQERIGEPVGSVVAGAMGPEPEDMADGPDAPRSRKRVGAGRGSATEVFSERHAPPTPGHSGRGLNFRELALTGCARLRGEHIGAGVEGLESELGALVGHRPNDDERRRVLEEIVEIEHGNSGEEGGECRAVLAGRIGEPNTAGPRSLQLSGEQMRMRVIDADDGELHFPLLICVPHVGNGSVVMQAELGTGRWK